MLLTLTHTPYYPGLTGNSLIRSAFTNQLLVEELYEMLFTTEGRRIHLLDHELLKFLHNLGQAKPLDSWQKCKDLAAHLHQQQVHLHLREQARVQNLPKRGTVRHRRDQEGTVTQPGRGPTMEGEPGQTGFSSERRGSGPNTRDPGQPPFLPAFLPEYVVRSMVPKECVKVTVGCSVKCGLPGSSETS